MTTFDREVPLPKHNAAVDWPAMTVGDSIDLTDRYATFESARSAVSQAAKRWGMKLATRKRDRALRVWRVA